MLEVSQLTRRYGQFTAVHNVSFSIRHSEIVGLLGHNGAGKTTIMKMLSGYMEPDAGRIEIHGQDIVRDAKNLQRDIGYLPENLPVYAEMTVADYLDYAATLKGLGAAEKFQEIKYAITATELEEKLASPINTLSRGYKQRVGVAQAVLGRPQLLILDEPTNGLDPTQTDHMRTLIRELAARATVILSTHIMQEVDALCSRVLILRSGELVVDEELSALQNDAWLLLTTSLNEADARSLFATIESVTSVATDTMTTAEQYRYRIQCTGTDRAVLSARIARAIVESGAALFQLQPQRRDLELLFRQVSQAKKELTDAA